MVASKWAESSAILVRLLCPGSARRSQWLDRGFRTVALAVGGILATASLSAAEDPASALKRSFDAAKSALAVGDLAQAESRYDEAIALGLRQLANLSLAQARFAEATRDLDQALKVAPGAPEITSDAAVAWFRAGDVKKARELATSVVAANPRHARALSLLGRIDLYRGDFDAAVRELEASVVLDHDFETSYFLGIAYLKAKRLSDAERWFAELQSAMGDSAALHVLIGRAYSISHFPESAVREFRKAIALDPKYPHAHELLGYSMLEFRGEEAYPQARIEFEKELKLHPDDYNALLLLGICDVSLRDFPAAEAALVHARRIRPDEAFAYLYLGETLSETNRPVQAVEILEKYLHLVSRADEAPRDVSRAYYLLGQSLRRLGRLDEAQKALASSQRYREAKFRYDVKHIFDQPGKPSDGDSHTSDRITSLVESGEAGEQKTAESLAQAGVQEPAVAARPVPESKAAKEYRAFAEEVLASSYNDLGVMRAKAANFVAAADFFQQAAQWKPALPGLDRNWGLASYRAQLYSQAIPPLERSLAANPSDAFVRQLLGLSYFINDNFAKAAEVFQPFLRSPPSDAGLLFAWGTSLVRTRQPALASQIFRRLLEQNANDPNVHLLLGQAYAEQSDDSNALAEFKSALQLDGRLAEAHYYVGLVELHQSDFESAAAEFRAELEIRPDDPVTSYYLGHTLLLAGQNEEAVTILRKVALAKPDYAPARLELGRALLEKGDTAGAIENLEAAKLLEPNRDTTYFQLSQAYRRAGRMADAAQALAVYQKLIEGNRRRRRESLETEKP